MLFIKKVFVVCLLLSSFVLFQSCDKDDKEEVKKGIVFTADGSLKININHVFNTETLKLAPQSYVTNLLDTIRITQLSYYITNITLTTVSGSQVNLGNASLINFIPSNQQTFTLNNIPAGHYTSISYLIGVDSIRNTSNEIKQGDLDPNLGMFWTWNTGYVFVRLNGRFGQAESGFTFDIGGTENIMSASHSLTNFSKSGTQAIVNLNMNVAGVFNYPNGYSLITNSSQIHNAASPGIILLRPNISSSFSLINIQ